MKVLSPILNLSEKFGALLNMDKEGFKQNNCFLYLNKNGIIKNVSDGFLNLTGYQKQNLRGNHISCFISYKKKEIVSKNISNLSIEEPFTQTNLKLIDVRNNIICVELYLTLTSLKDNAPVFAIFRKSDTHQQNYTSLFEKKENLRVLSENSSEVQLLFDTDVNCLYISPSCKKLTGYDYQSLINSNLYTFIHHDDLDKTWEAIKHSTNHQESNIIIRVKHANGKFVYVEVKIKTIKNEVNRITHYAAYAHDATHRIKNERQLLKSKYESDEANNVKSQFLTSVSHEFRTPLNAVIGFSKILAKMIEDPTIKTYINNIETSGVQLLDMVDNLLDFSRIEKEEIEPQITQIQLNPFFTKLEKQITNKFPLCNKPEVKINCEVETYDLIDFVNTDEKILNNIFENLINNAIKFTHNGYVKFGCKKYGINNYLFYVEDTGIGIEKDYQDDIFNVLTQHDGSLTREYSGIGIGLSVVKRMIDILNGEIWVMSEEGAGSAFYFTIPNKSPKM